MERKWLQFVFILLLFVFSCSKEPRENFVAETEQPHQTAPDYKIDANILSSLRGEPIFNNAVSFDNQKRIIEKMNSMDEESVDRADLLLMKPDDFTGLCKKYDCDVTPYLMFELGKTVRERSSLMKTDNVIKTKSETEYVAKCQAIKALVYSQIKTAYDYVRASNGISKDCDCSNVDTYYDLAVGDIDYYFRYSYPPESGECIIYDIAYQSSWGFKYDISSLSSADVTKLLRLGIDGLNTYFSRLQSEIKFIGNTSLSNYLLTFVRCHKTHTCRLCGQKDCVCCRICGKPVCICNDDTDEPSIGGGPGGGRPGFPCEYCETTNCVGNCYSNIRNAAPQAVGIFKINPDIPIEMWKQLEMAINGMIGKKYILNYLSKKLTEKISLTLNYNGGCKNTFLTNTISIRTFDNHLDSEDFVKSLFHIYQWKHYRFYIAESYNYYSMNFELEADTYIYLSYIIYCMGNQSSDTPPPFDSFDVEYRFRDWISECYSCFDNKQLMSINNQDYADFLTSYKNALLRENPFIYQDMRADTSKIMMSAMFDCFANGYF